MLKVDGGSSTIQRQPATVAKPTVKPATTNTNSPQSSNASVYSNRNQNTLQANLLRFKLNAQITLTAAQTTPTLTRQEAEQRADEIIAINGGKDNLNTDSVGRDLAEIARQNPAEAWAITLAMLGDEIDQDGNGRVEENDKDEIAQSFANALSDDELVTIGQNADGKALLEKFSTHLLSGSVHDDERDSALRLQTGVNGYPPPQLTGNPERDIQTVADDLKTISANKRDDYLMEVLQYPWGAEILQRAGVLNGEDRDILAGALNEAYRQNPTEISNYLNAVTDLEKNFPYYEWTGLADVVRRTGNDDLIAGYARHAINVAASGGAEKSSWSVDVLTALGGMSPEALQNFINFRSTEPPRYGSPTAIGQAVQNNQAAFQTMLTQAAGILGGPANNAGFENAWAFHPAMADFLHVASQMTDANGQLTSTALDIFKTIAPLTGDNFFTKEALGAFFIEHAQQLVDTFALPRNSNGYANENFDPNVLKDFFINVVYSPISHLLQYNGGSLTEAIFGDGNVNGGVLGEVTRNLMDKANQPGADVEYIGREIGYLFGAVSGGFLDSVEAYKDKFNDDKKFREFTYGLVNKGLAAIGKRIGVPLEKLGAFAQKLIEAGKADERSEQLAQFQEAFLDLKNDVSQQLINFQATHPNAEGLETNFTIAWNDFITSYLATDWIAR